MAATYVDHRTYTPQGQNWNDQQRSDFFGKLQTGSAVEGSPGKTWQHGDFGQGTGWYQSDAAASPGQPGAAPEPPRIDPQLQTVKPAGPQTPLPPSPAPQIPLGSPSDRYQTPGIVPTRVGNNTTRPGQAPGVIDQSQVSPQDPMQGAVRDAIMQMLGANVNEASITDADIAPQQRAYEAAVQRAALQNRADLMEQASVEGTLDSGATRSGASAINERAGQAIGEKNAELIGQKLQARRDQLNQAVQLATQMGMQKEANDLQRQLANLDAQLKTQGFDVTREGMQLQRDLANLDTSSKLYLADLDAKLRREGYSTQERLAQLDAEIRRMGITSQADLGQLELALRRELGVGQLNLNLLGLQLQNQQFNDQLGWDMGKYESMLNNSIISQLSGG